MQRVAELQNEKWLASLAREGLPPVECNPRPGAEGVACPACGTVAPLVDGACSDCGLVLDTI